MVTSFDLVMLLGLESQRLAPVIAMHPGNVCIRLHGSPTNSRGDIGNVTVVPDEYEGDSSSGDHVCL